MIIKTQYDFFELQESTHYSKEWYLPEFGMTSSRTSYQFVARFKAVLLHKRLWLLNAD